MNLNQRIKAFATLGKILNNFKEQNTEPKEEHSSFERMSDLLHRSINQAKTENAWFTEPNILYALDHWGKLLTEEKLSSWFSSYKVNSINPKTVAIVMAGNIPLVGFHDYLSVLISGHSALIKQSSNDRVLLKAISECLISIKPEFKDRIKFEENKLTNFDAVIATGSDNTARYFDYYFGKYPNIIRKNRNSVAVLTGEETLEDLRELSKDIFRYYGLGCRNVSKIFVPENYNFDTFFNAVYDWNPIIHEHKYANNYDYNKAVYLMSEYEILDNGFLILKEDSGFASPIATLFYEEYNNQTALNERLAENESKIQCIVSGSTIVNSIPFGQTQKPKLDTYADNIDTVDFLLKI